MAISQYRVGSQEDYRRNRDCLPEIATAPSGPRNDKSEAFAILTVACTDCKCAAGPGCPLTYNGGCDQRDCLPEIAPQGHFLALRAQGATSAFGLLAMTNLGALLDRRACLQICSCHRRSMSAATDAIGACHFIGSWFASAVPSRDCHGPAGASQ